MTYASSQDASSFDEVIAYLNGVADAQRGRACISLVPMEEPARASNDARPWSLAGLESAPPRQLLAFLSSAPPRVAVSPSHPYTAGGARMLDLDPEGGRDAQTMAPVRGTLPYGLGVSIVPSVPGIEPVDAWEDEERPSGFRMIQRLSTELRSLTPFLPTLAPPAANEDDLPIAVAVGGARR